MKKMSLKEFVEKARAVQCVEYDYSLVRYMNNYTPVQITCKKHGIFLQAPKEHLKGSQCPSCSDRKSSKSIFVAKAMVVHGKNYFYDKVKYKNNKTAVEIKCLQCGIYFIQTPQHHLRGSGCSACSKVKPYNNVTFATAAGMNHNNKYNYKNVVYKNNKTEVEILCKEHGTFKQRPDAHLRGVGCPKCKRRVSGKETTWLDALGIDERQKRISLMDGTYIFADGFKGNTIYEFLGDFWHGNLDRYNGNDINRVCKKTMDQLNCKTFERLEKIVASGFNVFYIWESIYDSNNKEGK